jgi:hypothetical protein
MLSFAYKFALSLNPLPYLELVSEFVINVKTITKFWIYVGNKSLLYTKLSDLMSFYIVSFDFKFGWLTIKMSFFEFVNEFSVFLDAFQHDIIMNNCEWICSMYKFGAICHEGDLGLCEMTPCTLRVIQWKVVADLGEPPCANTCVVDKTLESRI